MDLFPTTRVVLVVLVVQAGASGEWEWAGLGPGEGPEGEWPEDSQGLTSSLSESSEEEPGDFLGLAARQGA